MNGGPERVRGLGLRLAASALNERALRLLGPRLPRLAASGWMPWLKLDRYEPRGLPGADWLRVRPTLAGICGTDMALLTGRATDAMSPFTSFPAVLGHEVVGRVVEVGAEVGDLAVGDRIVADPVISCFVRGLVPCRECADGHPSTCTRSTEGALSPGLIVGYCRDLPGAWGDEMLVHRSQVYPVPDTVDDDAAVLVEPLSVALHAVLRRPPGDGERVLVIGGGAMGLLTLVALRLVGGGGRPVALARHTHQRSLAERLGEARVVRTEAEAAAEAGAVAHRTLTGGTTYAGGYEVVYDCAGSRDSLDLAFRLAGPRGRVVVLGGPGHVGRLDWTPAWVRELVVEGSYVYGREPSVEGSPHTFEVALRLLAEGGAGGIGELVTHRFALERWREAMAAGLRRGSSGALKVVFAMGERGS